MSAILVMVTLDRRHLPSPEGGADVPADLGRPVGPGYDWSGHCMLHTLLYLEDRGVTIGGAGEYFQLDTADRDAVHPARHDLDALAGCLAEEFGGGDTAVWAEAGLDSLRLLHDETGRLTGDEVLLLRID